MKLMPNVIEGPIEASAINPYELIDLIHQHDMEAFEELNMHSKVYYKTIYKDLNLAASGIGYHDWMQEAAVVLWDCVWRYRMDLKIPFYSFMRSALSNRAMSLRRQAARAQQGLSTQIVSLDQMIEENQHTYRSWKAAQDTGRLTLSAIQAEYLQKELEKKLDPKQFAIVEMLCEGYSRTEIAHSLGVNSYFIRKTIDKCRQVLQVDTTLTS